MINTELLRSRILSLAMRGELTERHEADGNAMDLYANILDVKSSLISSGEIRKDKKYSDIEETDIPFQIPENWEWVRFGKIINLQSGQDLKPSEYNDNENGIPYITGASNYNDDGSLTINRWTECPKAYAKRGDILLSCKGTVGKLAILKEEKVHIARQIMGIRTFEVNVLFMFYYLQSMIYGIKEAQKGLIPGIERNDVLDLLCPLPPVAEQERIVVIIEELFNELEVIDVLQDQYASDAATLKSKLIDAAIQGKLTNQLDEDGTAEELYHQVQEERKRQEQAGIIKEVELLPAVSLDETPFTIPNHWKWTSLGNVSYIVRGGSPRPIKEYITNSEDGINWIKIGDVEKGGKYILSTNEKIKPEGESKSRRVYPGDFLLTNSMSFGRPYISKIEGCIHDGWLLIRNLNGFNPDYLYYLLSSTYLYNQFTVKASGSTVDNLNIDKVKGAIIPLPPLAEQKRIAERIDELLTVLP